MYLFKTTLLNILFLTCVISKENDYCRMKIPNENGIKEYGVCLPLKKCRKIETVEYLNKTIEYCSNDNESPKLICCPLEYEVRNKGNIGASCTSRSTNIKGICVHESKCKNLYAAASSLDCSAPDILFPEITCCPFESELIDTGKRSKAACNHYKQLHINGLPHPLKIHVYLGVNAKLNEFAHMAALGYDTSIGSISWGCGGSIISDRFILTAAHCANSLDFGAVKWAALGTNDLNINTSVVPILEMIIHPNYKKPSHYYNDIALLRMEPLPAIFPEAIKPACLHTDLDVQFKTPVVITGWGKTQFFGDLSTSLLKTQLSVVPQQECATRYVKTKRLLNGIDQTTQFCAGSFNGNDACPGDSGGPIQTIVDENYFTIEHYLLFGIISFGKACGFEASAGVYTRIYPFIDWIESIVWPLYSLQNIQESRFQVPLTTKTDVSSAENMNKGIHYKKKKTEKVMMDRNSNFFTSIGDCFLNGAKFFSSSFQNLLHGTIQESEEFEEKFISHV